MELLNVGDRVALNKAALSVSYIVARQSYTNMFVGKTGTIIGISSGDSKKYAIEFDTEVFTRWRTKQSSHDNGCNGKGKLHYCWYIPIDCVDLIVHEAEGFFAEATKGSRNVRMVSQDEDALTATAKTLADYYGKKSQLFPLDMLINSGFSKDTPYHKQLEKGLTLHGIHGFNTNPSIVKPPTSYTLNTNKAKFEWDVWSGHKYEQLEEDYYITLIDTV